MSDRDPSSMPRVLFVGRTRYTLPLPAWLAKKFAALDEQLNYRVLASAQNEKASGDERFRLLAPAHPRVLDGILFYLRCPFAVRREIKEFEPEAIVAESPYTGAAAIIGRSLVRAPHPRVVVEVHGDWRTATRLYGSPWRRVISPIADYVSRLTLRHGDAVRTLSPFTSGLVEEVLEISVTASFPTYTDLSAFTAEPVKPLPERPSALFVGMLESYKNIDGLSDAWRQVAAELPDARFVIVGKGARLKVVSELVADFPDRVEYVPELSPTGVADCMDDSTFLVLPSRSEGLGRVIIESFARARPVVATRVGGIPDLVEDGVNGILVESGDTGALADALISLLRDPKRAEALGRAAHERAAELEWSPGDYAARVRSLVDRTLSSASV